MQYEGTDLNTVLAEREAELNRREAELRRVEQEVARLEALRVEMLRVAAQLDMREASLAARTHVRAPEPEPLLRAAALAAALAPDRAAVGLVGVVLVGAAPRPAARQRPGSSRSVRGKRRPPEGPPGRFSPKSGAFGAMRLPASSSLILASSRARTCRARRPIVLCGFSTLTRLGALAQLGERRLCKPEVTGSIPVRSIKEVLQIGQTCCQFGDKNKPLLTVC